METTPEEKKRPGGSLRSRLAIERVKVFKQYAERFWTRNPSPEARESMRSIVERQCQTGVLRVVAGGHFTVEDKEQLSAYRILAEKLGYAVGAFRLSEDKKTYTASAQKEAEL